MALTNATPMRNALSDAFDAQINSGANPGGLRLWTGTAADGTMLVEFEFAATAFGAAATGVITLAGVPIEGTAEAAGTAQSFDIVKDLAGTPEVQVDGDVGAELTMNNAVIANGQTVNLTALTYTTPAS